MTRSCRFRHRAPALVPVALLLAVVGCGGRSGDATADTAPVPAAADAPAGPRAASESGAVPAANGGSAGTGQAAAAPPGLGPAGSNAGGSAPSAPSTVVPVTIGSVTTARPASTAPASTGTVTTATTATTAPPVGQRLAGTVTASPTCPVERPDQPCAPRPVAAHIEVFDRTEQLVASTDADSDGRFAVTLAPGRYRITASSGAVFPSCPPLTVEVPASGAARADIACDTGIR